MRKLSQAALCLPALALLIGPQVSRAQDAAGAPTATKASPYASILGAVTAIDTSAKSITLKPDTGDPSTIQFDDKTHFMKLAPGEKDLKKATDIQLSEIAPGDRLLARVRKLDNGSTSPATTIVVMTKAELVKHQQATLQEWQERGLMGNVTVVNPATKEVTFKTNSADPKEVVIEPSDKVQVRKYAPDSVRFADAKPSAMTEIKTGDTVRVLGTKNEEGTRVQPEEIVYGTFVRQAGTISNIDAASGKVTIKDLATKKLVVVTVNAGTTMKKLPENLAAMMARQQQGGGQGGPGGGGPGGGGPGGGGRAQGGPPAGGGPPGGPGGPGGMPRRLDPSRILERAPTITLADLKSGDAIIISSSAGSDPSAVTAITLVAGVEPLLTAPNKGGQQGLSSSWNFEMSAPQ